MATNHPVDFSERAARPKGEKGSDYPYALSAQDLMKNFVYAAVDVDPSWIVIQAGEKGYPQRKLNVPPVPSSGIYVLGAFNGKIVWIATEGC